MRNITMVIGCGRLGSSLANYASAQGDNVVVLDPKKESFERLNDSFSGYRITCNAEDIEELEDAGIENAKEVCVTTGDDNVNLFIARVCCELYEVPYVYVRFEDPDKGLLIQGLPIKAIYPFQLSRDRYNALKAGTEN